MRKILLINLSDRSQPFFGLLTHSHCMEDPGTGRDSPDYRFAGFIPTSSDTTLFSAIKFIENLLTLPHDVSFRSC
ncbi:hypothetical protein [Ekhidna sp.]|uniref:hypothetical protein n=1 Tax=Ekhidna sp. TaxID=2608089 RepID=UPI0032ED2A34